MEKKEKKRRKKFWTFLFRFVAASVVSFLVTLSIVVLFLSIKPTRNWLAEIGIQILNNNLNGKISYKEIDFSPFSGIRINNFLITLGSDTVIFSRNVRLDWDFSPLLQKKVFLKFVKFENPYFNFRKLLGDSLWNFEKITKQSDDNSPSEPPNLVIFLNNVQLENGQLAMLDENDTTRSHTFNPSNFSIKNLNLKLGGKLSIGEQKFSISIANLNFYEEKSSFVVVKSTADIFTNKDTVDVNNFVLQTKGSSINLTSRIYLLQYPQLDFEIKKSTLRTEDLQKFVELPFAKDAVIKINGKVKLDSTIKFDNIGLNFGKSYIVCDGKVENLSHPISPKLSFIVRNLEIYQSDLPLLFGQTFLNIPIDSKFFNSKNLTFELEDGRFKFNGNAITGSGLLDFNFSFDNSANYNLRLRFNSFNLATILQTIPKTSLDGTLEAQFNLGHNSNSNGWVKLNIDKGKAEYKGLENWTLSCTANLFRGMLTVDTLQSLFFWQDTLSHQNIGKLNLSGSLNLAEFKNPDYSGLLSFSNINLDAFRFSGGNLPQRLSGEISFNGKGYNPNSIDLNLKANFMEFAFSDRDLLPFEIDLDVHHSSPGNKFIRIHSLMMDAVVEGEYEFLDLVTNFGTQIQSITKSFENKLKVLEQTIATDSVTTTNGTDFSQSKIVTFHPARFNAELRIGDFSLISVLLKKNIVFSGNAKLFFENTEKSCYLKLDSMAINYLTYTEDSTKYSLLSSNLSANYEIEVIDSVPYVKFLSAKLLSDSRIAIGGLYFDFPTVDVNFQKDSLNIIAQTGINGTVELAVQGKGNFTDKKIEISFPTFNFGYSNIFQWQASSPITLSIEKDGYHISQMQFKRENAETVSIFGYYLYDGKINIKAHLDSLPLNDFQKLLPQDNALSNIKTFEGTVESLDLSLGNTLDNPDIDLNLFTKKLLFENYELGNFLANIKYRTNNIYGKIRIEEADNSLLSVEIVRFPISIELSKGKFALNQNEQFFAKVESNQLPLSIFSPLVASNLEKLEGKAITNLDVYGYLPDNLFFKGSAEIVDASFRVLANNIVYRGQGKVLFDGTKVMLDNLHIYNLPSDNKNGLATINGIITFENNQIQDIDIALKASNLKVLSSASAKSHPNLFGDLIISTGENQLRYSGKPNDAKVEGNLEITKGKLYLPSVASRESVAESFVRYEFAGNKENQLGKNSTTLFNNPNSDLTNLHSSSGSSNLKIDLFIRLVNPIELTMDITTLGKMYAIITMPDGSSTLHYYSDPRNNVTLLTGSDLVLREGSTLNFIKLFRTQGAINFPTGNLENPNLDIKAEYSGESIYSDAVRNFTISIFLTGTKERPSVRFEYAIDNQVAKGDSSRITQDALFLLAFGRTKSEFERGSGNEFNINELYSAGRSTVISSGATVLVSQFITNALSGTGFVSSADITFSESSLTFDKAKLRMSGNFLGLNWNFGGTVADLMNNNELSIEVPFGSIFQPEPLQNLILQLSRTTNLTQTPQRNQKEWEVKVKWGDSW